jgi:hypothetical protein
MLKHFHRHRMPTDGTWVRTETGLDSIVRETQRHVADAEVCRLPVKLENVWVPVWVKLVTHKGQATPQNPEAIYYHPIVRVGHIANKEEIEIQSCYSAGLSQDCTLDGIDNCNMWHYRPYDDYYMANAPVVPPGEDECSICEQVLYRDESGRRDNRSATIYDGSLVCRTCEVNGAVYAQDVEDRLIQVRKVCDYIGKTYHVETVANFERRWDRMNHPIAWEKPNQTHIWLDGEWSFYWQDFALVEPGQKRKPGMNGGLIMHGPTPVSQSDGTYKFTTYDYDKRVQRPATPEEISGLTWGCHT